VFGTKSNLTRLFKSKVWFVSGTFKTSPHIFYQCEREWTVSREKTKRQGRKSANYLELKNRFETLTKSPSKDNLTSKANDKAKQATKPKSKTKQTKKKVLLLADSNGRGCSAKLKKKN